MVTNHTLTEGDKPWYIKKSDITFLLFCIQVFLNLFLTFECRCVENNKVTEQLPQVWDDMKQLFVYWEKLPNSKRWSSKSYQTVKKVIGDSFIVSRSHFFTYVSGLFELFFALFQTDKPMIPFSVPIMRWFGIKVIRDNC